MEDVAFIGYQHGKYEVYDVEMNRTTYCLDIEKATIVVKEILERFHNTVNR